MLISSSTSESWVVTPNIGNILGFHAREHSIILGQAICNSSDFLHIVEHNLIEAQPPQHFPFSH